MSVKTWTRYLKKLWNNGVSRKHVFVLFFTYNFTWNSRITEHFYKLIISHEITSYELSESGLLGLNIKHLHRNKDYFVSRVISHKSLSKEISSVVQGKTWSSAMEIPLEKSVGKNRGQKKTRSNIWLLKVRRLKKMTKTPRQKACSSKLWRRKSYLKFWREKVI